MTVRQAAGGLIGAVTAAAVVGTAGAAPSSHTGTLVLAIQDADDRVEIAVAKPDGTGFKKLTHQRPGGFLPHWAADGRSIVFETSSSLWRMTPRGTRLRKVRPRGEPSPSATKFARLFKHGVDIFSAKGRRIRVIPLPLGRNDFYDSVLWSSDSGNIAIGVGTEDDNADYARVFVASVKGRESARVLSRRIRKGERDDFPIAWSRDGRRLLLEHEEDRRDEAHIVDVATGARRKVRSDFLQKGVRWYAASPDLDRVAFIPKSGSILTVPLNGGRRRVLSRKKGADLVTWSLSGRRLAYSDKDGTYVVNRDGSHRRRITSIAAQGSPPEWSPNDTRIVFSVGHEAIYVVQANGRGIKLLTKSLWDDSPQWSPDGTKIAFLRGPYGLEDSRRLRIAVMNRDGTGQRTIGRGYGPRWSPDGRLVAFVDPPGGLTAGDIHVATPDGSSDLVVGEGATPTWSPTGTRLAFMRYAFKTDEDGTRAVSSQLFVVGADGTGLREVEVPGHEVLLSPDWAPDDHTLVFAYNNYDAAESATVFIDVDQPGHTWSVGLAGAAAYVWSPNGELLAFEEYDGVKVARPDGSDLRTLTHGLEGPSTPVWSPDGSALAFVAGRELKKGADPTYDVYVVAADGSGQKRVTKTPGVEGAVDWGP